MDNDLRPRERYDELSNAWRHSADGTLVATPPTPPPAPRKRRAIFIAALAVHVLIVAAVVVGRATAPQQAAAMPGSTGDWRIELESAGSGPVTALVYGPETGMHLIKVPAADAPAAEKRTMTAKLGKGEVRMISFGRSSLRIKATSPSNAKGGFIDAGAKGRIITLFSDARGSGVRTGW